MADDHGEAIRQMSESLADFRQETGERFGTLIEGQKNMSALLEKHDTTIDSHTREIEQTKGITRATRWIGAVLIGAITLVETVLHLGEKIKGVR